uniref:Uncharacterized protein n=1 Tax=Arundo donax TaxID=35708 RepID=A0A0A9GD21_ARUDO
MKIGCRDVSRVPASAESTWGLFFFDFFFEREILPEEKKKSASIKVGVADEVQPSAKKFKAGGSSHVQTENESAKGGDNGQNTMNVGKHYIMVTPCKDDRKYGSAPAKFQGKLMANAQKSHNTQTKIPAESEGNQKGKEQSPEVESWGDDSEDDDYDLLVDNTFQGGESAKGGNSNETVGLMSCSNVGHHTQAIFDNIKLLMGKEKSSVQITEVIDLEDPNKAVKTKDDTKIDEVQETIARETRRRSEIIQKEMMAADEEKKKQNLKRKFEGNNLNTANSFSILNQDEIMFRAKSMGIIVDDDIFAKIDMLQDLESARIALAQKQELIDRKACNEPLGESEVADIPNLALENIVSEASETEEFILVESKKKKRQAKGSMKNSASKYISTQKILRAILAEGKEYTGNLFSSLLPQKTKRNINNERPHLELQGHQEKRSSPFSKKSYSGTQLPLYWFAENNASLCS